MAQKKQPARSRILAAGGDLRTVTAAARLAEHHTVLLAGFDRLETLPAGLLLTCILRNPSKALRRCLEGEPGKEETLPVKPILA